MPISTYPVAGTAIGPRLLKYQVLKSASSVIVGTAEVDTGLIVTGVAADANRLIRPSFIFWAAGTSGTEWYFHIKVDRTNSGTFVEEGQARYSPVNTQNAPSPIGWTVFSSGSGGLSVCVIKVTVNILTGSGQTLFIGNSSDNSNAGKLLVEDIGAA